MMVLGGIRMKVAILGMGTVGSGVIKVFQENYEKIEAYVGEALEVTHVFGGTINNTHNADLTGITITDDIEEIYNSGVDIVVEVMGGIDFTYNIHKHFLSKGIHVISANKDMLAEHIDELAEIGNANKAQLSYEASSAGGIPIINSILYGFNANKITRVMGILNGTTNYILTKMTHEGWDYHEALEEAQKLGFAEADPTADVEGLDARRKITLLSRIAYDRKIVNDDVPVKGISQVEVDDIEIGKDAGLVMKLLGSSEFDGEELIISVEPTFLSMTHQLAYVNEAQNAVYVNGNAVGEAMLYGPGAGSLETASAVVSDLANTARFGFIGNALPKEDAVIAEANNHNHYYIRFAAHDEKEIEDLMAELDINALTIDADHEDYVIQTEAIPLSVLEKIKEKLDIKAVYPIVTDKEVQYE